MSSGQTKINVLLGIRQGKIGGGESHVFDLAKNLDQSKIKPVVLSFTDGPMVTNLKNIGITVEVIKTARSFDLLVLLKVVKLIKKYNIDIIHAHGTRAASNLLFASKIVGKPILYTVHGWSFNDAQSRKIRTIRKLGESFISKNVDLIINVSQSNQRTGKQLYRGFKSLLIKCGINRDKFSYQTDGNEFRQKNDLSKEFIWFALIARMTFQKDPLNIIRGFNLAQKENAKIRLVLVGEGELDNEKNELIRNFNLEEKVRILPFHENIPEVLAAIDVYCLVSLWEGLPIGLLEAMSMKKACIVSPADGILEVIVDRENGLIVDKSNPEQLKSAMLELANNSEFIKTFGEKAYQKIDEDFSIERMVTRIEKEYSRLI
ncbi:glycosyltransferase [Marivirga harenae]|uniref:glycosyltransferase n=1 Tax=Marivirga harenae TaxID=2010992 RepID=UPI0026E0053B|nr:glycosyltransferase [Marivirga harenae]WKV12905.1 glycosyltransferase [Marivirga harenae]